MSHFYFAFDQLIVLISWQKPRLQIWNVIEILEKLHKIRLEQVIEFFGREGVSEIILSLVYFEHDAKERYFFLNYVFHGMLKLRLIFYRTTLHLFSIDVFYVSRRFNLDAIRKIGCNHPIKRIVIVFHALVQGIFHHMLRQFKESSKSVIIDNCAFIVFPDFKVFLYCLMDFGREGIYYLSDSLMIIMLLSMLKILEFCVS